jgi:hypothetical protein
VLNRAPTLTGYVGATHRRRHTMHLTLLLPPLTQLNTPYPSIAYLNRHLRERGQPAELRDLGLELILRLFSRAGLTRLFDAIEAIADDGIPEPAWKALAARDSHERGVDAAVAFLQGRDRTLARRMLSQGGLPSGPRLEALDSRHFGPNDVEDLARHRATLYLSDLADLVTATVDPGFALARYQHHLAEGPVPWGPIEARLGQTTLPDALLDELVDGLPAPSAGPWVVGLSVPFPGTLLGALRIGRRLRNRGATVLMGGGYVSTELRSTALPELWTCVDHLVYDDGEEPLDRLLEWLQGGPDRRLRTRSADGDHGMDHQSRGHTAVAWYGQGAAGLRLPDYLQVVDSLNPAHRLWGDGRWNKATLAHGCYWRRCAFCDIDLDYIRRYEPANVSTLVDQLEEVVAATGTRGVHLVDEAAPPRLMRDLALELLARGHDWSWWGNIRFERSFTPDLCRLLSASGLVMVTGGLEVASDRLLVAMDKGITVSQAARSASAFQQAGVLVHAYLMYGFPSQTEQELVDAWEVVRQMLAEGLLSSAFWHRFVLTGHSGVNRDPAAYGVVPLPLPKGPLLATNDLPHRDLHGADPDPWDDPLARSLTTWMRGEGLDRPLQSWMERRMPSVSVGPGAVRAMLTAPVPTTPDDQLRLIWLGHAPLDAGGAVHISGPGGTATVPGSDDQLGWLMEVVDAATAQGSALTIGEATAAFPGKRKRFEPIWQELRRVGLVAI